MESEELLYDKGQGAVAQAAIRLKGWIATIESQIERELLHSQFSIRVCWQTRISRPAQEL